LGSKIISKIFIFDTLAPVVTTKKALNGLKKELKDMEVEIGVMEHCVLKSLMQEQSILRDGSKI